MILLLLLLVTAGGTLATYWCDESDPTPFLVRLAAGAVLGVTVFGLVGLALALFASLTIPVVLVAAAVAAVPAVLLRKARWRARVKADLRQIPGTMVRHWRTAIVISLMALGLSTVFEGALYETPEGIFTADHHNLGDLPFHISIVNQLVHGANLPPEHPELAGTVLTYPFLVDFVAALLMRGGMSLRAAFFTENALLAVALLGLLIHWGTRLTRDRMAGLLVPPLALLTGGLGFWRYFFDAAQSGHNPIALLAQLPRDYTIARAGDPWPLGALRWGNALTTLLVPQRAFLLGLALALIVWTLVWDAVNTGDPERRQRRLTIAGLVLGLVPLAHTHTFLALLASAICLALLFPDRRAWSRFFLAAGALAGPQIVWLFAGSSMSAHSFIGWEVGWDRSGDNPLWFWLHNTGLVIPAVVFALLYRGRTPIVPRTLARFLLPWTGCFIVPNLLRLSPWIWDNIKFLFYAHLAATPILALLLLRLWRGHRVWGQVLATVLLLSFTLAGTLDVIRVVSRSNAQRIFDTRAIAFAEFLREYTPPDALVLRAPTYNHAVLFAGRRSLLGYLGHIYSHGLDPGTRWQDIIAVYRGDTDALERLHARQVTHVVVGPHEQVPGLNRAFLDTLTFIGETDGYRLYAVPEE